MPTILGLAKTGSGLRRAARAAMREHANRSRKGRYAASRLAEAISIAAMGRQGVGKRTAEP